MTRTLVKCLECQRDRYPNQLTQVEESVIIKKMVCQDCLGYTNTMGDIEANKRNAARATAWNNGNGWEI